MKFILLFAIIMHLALPAYASEITAPPVPDTGVKYMPQDTESFGEALWQMLKYAALQIQPDLSEGSRVCMQVTVIVLLASIICQFPSGEKSTIHLISSVSISVILLGSVNALIHLGAQTIQELNEYGKLLLPVMTSALAAQGGITSSAALYTGTAIFNSVLCSAISSLLIPMVYLYLATAIAGSVVGEEILEKITGFLKWLIVWSLKTILYVFTGYISITGVISGATDASAVKAAKLTISGFVPVVGGILSDASEAVLIGAGVVKNAVGIYGMLAIIAVFIGPFLKIGCHYILLKATSAISSITASKQITKLIEHFSASMALLLAMTGSICLLLLISTVCFIKGVG